MLYVVPPVGSVSVFIKKGPLLQAILAKVPETTSPSPICNEISPLAFVVGVWVST